MAVQAINGANLMIAVPGSGKTTVIVARMGYMIFCKGIAPENILAITYTKSATKDIKDRFADKFGQEIANRLNIRTINSLCYKIVSEYSKESNAPYTMLTQNEQENIIRQVYINVTDDKYPHEADLLSVQIVISYAKNMMLTTPEMRSQSRCYSENPKYEEMYLQYRDMLRNQHKMDFDDQLVYAKSILEKRPQILQRIQAQYQYICVDEAQDTSKIQHCIIRQISEYSNNIFMVGDEDQSIYGFRAAYPQALLDFTDTYVNPYMLFLETNYRSTSQIVYLGCFPQLDAWKNMQNGEIEEYEEERRLFYVAMTREKNELYLFTIKESSAMFIDEVIPLVKDGYYHYNPNARMGISRYLLNIVPLLYSGFRRITRVHYAFSQVSRASISILLIRP